VQTSMGKHQTGGFRLRTSTEGRIGTMAIA
jgi:hypothetical protein